MPDRRPSTASRARALLAFAFLIPLACEGAASSEPDEWDELVEPVAGSRLQPLFRTAEDGTRVQIGWHDTLFDTPCAFGPTPSAERRCLPTTSGNDVWLYADANCTEPVLQDIWIPEGATVVGERGDSCFDKTFYEVGEPVAEIYYSDNGPCQFFSNDPAHRVTMIPYEQFVSATLTPQPGESRIVPILLQADDGARQIVGAWDREHEEEVRAVVDDQQQRWLGFWEPRVSTYYYADANCTERVALAECVPDSEQPTTAMETEAGSCGSVLGRHQLGEEVAQVYADGGGSCEPVSFTSTRAWRVGAPLDQAAFAESSAIDGGGERLRHDIYANPEGEPFLASGRVYDRQLGEVECRWRDPVTYSDDPSTSATFDCVPVDAASFEGRFLDSACTTRTAAYWVSEEDSCPSEVSHAYGEGMAAAISGPTSGEGGYGLDDANACVLLAPSEPADGGGGEYEYYITDDTLIEVAHAVDEIE